MDRHFQQQAPSTINPPTRQEEPHLQQQPHNPGYHERPTHRHTHQQRMHNHHHHHQRSQAAGPVPFGIYSQHCQDLPRSVSSASSSPQQQPTPSSMPAAAPAHFVVKDETTTVKVPMLRPRPGLLKVLHLSGGVGETFTMGEVINYVKEYIRERALYDQQDPRIVHCAGDLLGLALGVDTFTVHDAIGLFHKNCTMEPDSCIRIHRHMVTRSATPQSTTSVADSSAAPSGTNIATVAPHIVTSHLPLVVRVNETSTDLQQRTEASRQQPIELEICTSIQNLLQSDTSLSLTSSSLMPSSLSSSSSQPSSSSSLPSSSSILSSAVIKFKAAQSFVTVTDSDLEKSGGEQAASSGDSSSDEGKRGTARDQHRRKGLGKSNGQKRTRMTSINVTYDEPDGATEPWTCEVMMETSAGEMTKPENDTLVVEFDSDAFSVEYEVESDPETDPGGAKPSDQACVESDESSSASGAAILLVCKESDVEYLADYSDSDNGSNAEFSDADQWECEHCLKRNPPFQRNCGGCWSVRPHWLPSNSKEKESGASYDKPDSTATDLPCSDKLLQGQQSLQQSQENSQEALKSSQEQGSIISTPNKSPLQTGKNKNCGSKRRRCSSSLSDSQDGKKNEKLNSDIVAVSRSDESKYFDGKNMVDTSASRDDPCVVCLTRKKTASIIHGKTGHQICCYRCARRLKEQRKPCPICRRPIQKVVRNFIL